MSSGLWVGIEDLIGLLVGDRITRKKYNDWLESEGFNRVEWEEIDETEA